MGEQHYKRVSTSEKKSCLFIIFWEDFLPWKCLKIALKTHEIAPFLKIFLGEHAPKPPYQKLAASLLATCRFAASISKIPEILKLGPPPEKSCIRPCWSYWFKKCSIDSCKFMLFTIFICKKRNFQVKLIHKLIALWSLLLSFWNYVILKKRDISIPIYVCDAIWASCVLLYYIVFLNKHVLP